MPDTPMPDIPGLPSEPFFRRDLTDDIRVMGVSAGVHLSHGGRRLGYYESSSLVFEPSQARQLAALLVEVADPIDPDVGAAPLPAVIYDPNRVSVTVESDV